MKQLFLEKLIKTGVFFSLIAYIVFYYFWGERLPVRDGLGWDGIVYGAYARDFFSELRTNTDAYHISRCFPSFVIWCFCKITHIQLNTNSTIFTAFFIFNNICFLWIALLWNKFCQLKNLTFPTFIIGCICFFCNFAFLKYYQYAAVATDVFALLLGMLALYFYLKKSLIALNTLLIPTMLSWPIGIVFIFILSVLCTPPINPVFRKPPVKIVLFLTLGYMVLLIALSSTTYLHDNYQAMGTDIAQNLAVISATIAGIYIFIIGKEVQPVLLIKGLCLINIKNAIGYIVFITITLSLYYYLLHMSPYHNGAPSATSPSLILKFLLLDVPTGPLIKPSIFLTMQVANWGPTALLFLFFCRDMIKKAYGESIGMVLLLLISYYFSLNPQYRFNSFLIPITIYLLCLVINDLKITIKTCQWFALISLFSSKVYYSLNSCDIPYHPSVNDLYNTCLQRFFMNTGYWVSWPGYYITLAITIISAFLMIALGYRVLQSKANYYNFRLATKY